MRQVLSLLGLLVALASSDANPKINAPVPNSPPPPSIDWKYASSPPTTVLVLSAKAALGSPVVDQAAHLAWRAA